MGRELATEKRDDIFAATPTLESLKSGLSLRASHQDHKDPWRLMAVDVKRVYFYAAVTMPIFIHILMANPTTEDTGMVAQLNFSLHGTRDAAQNWATTVAKFLNQCGFALGRASLRNFHHVERDMALAVHCDNFIVSGAATILQWMRREFERRFEVATPTPGPEAGRE